MSSGVGEERFDTGASAYAAYLDTAEGQLRTEIALANVQDHMPAVQARPLTALDVGCGTGVAAIRLAQLGLQVTGVDVSEAMLEIATARAAEAGASGRIVLKHGTAELVGDAAAPPFDVVLCHFVLEYVADPRAVLRVLAGTLRDESSILSVVVRNRAGEVIKAAIGSGDLDAATLTLTAEWGRESLYGGAVRLFSPAEIREVLREASLSLVAERGVRVVSDYLPKHISREAEYAKILELERTLGQQPEFAAVARYTQSLACRAQATTGSKRR